MLTKKINKYEYRLIRQRKHGALANKNSAHREQLKASPETTATM
jgi:hypothetical protein